MMTLLNSPVQFKLDYLSPFVLPGDTSWDEQYKFKDLYLHCFKRNENPYKMSKDR